MLDGSHDLARIDALPQPGQHSFQAMNVYLTKAVAGRDSSSLELRVLRRGHHSSPVQRD